MTFTPLGKALDDKISDKSALKQQVEASQIVEIAEKVLEEMFGELSKHAKPLFLKNRTLTISCSTSVMAQEIRLNQMDIVEKVNKALGKKEVDRIRYLT
jgi:predicted nucleic acid-binding Zn ribbon protein